jgi:NADH dehydrogenase/NADH:ubiquinone oxidoreductase subunit G
MSVMAQTLKLYDYNTDLPPGKKPPKAMIDGAKVNEAEQVLLQQMAEELKGRISSLEAKGPVAGLKELKEENARLQKYVQGQGGSSPTRVQLASEIVLDLKGQIPGSEHALLRVELRKQAEGDFASAVRSGDSIKIAAYKALLLEQATAAAKAWQEVVEKVEKNGAKPEVIKNFKENFRAADAKCKEIQKPDYGM